MIDAQTVTDMFNDREFWLKENLLYAQPNYRLRRCARLVNERARGRQCDLLDVGCGPAALRPLLPPAIAYHGVDIAIHEPAPYLLERDFVRNEISFGDRRFDFVVALGVFEYMGHHQARKFDEIRSILAPGGTFVMSYINFRHYRRAIFPAYNNIQSIGELTASLRTAFRLERCFPVSHHWRHRQPGTYASRVQLPLGTAVPGVSSWLAVEYFCVCSARA